MELLAPAGDFECLKAAVQNGADSVYFGASSFSARAFANNFDNETLEMAINYAKLRNVKTHLTLNTLITDDEFEDAIKLAEHAYNCGIDAIIVQDFGLARYLIDHFPGLDVHGSTQMTIHNLECVQTLEKFGFKRAVLSRELPISEIYDICQKTNIETEVFIHGALCLSYSGQCLLSSMIGGRSGNRGKCAQPCRLPYKVNGIDNNFKYLMSPKDLCGLEFIPDLIDAGVSCFKIEGRMKKPEYVATVTRIYRKYIDKYLNKENYVIDKKDMNDLLQVFNRGGFSSGHLQNSPNTDFVYPEKPNNAGIYIGNISNYSSNKGYVSFTLHNSISIGDVVSFDNDHKKYTVSELMRNGKNVETANKDDKITIGRMKGKISLGSKIYKLTSKNLSNDANSSFTNTENIKIPLNANITLREGEPIILKVSTINTNDSIYNNITVTQKSESIAVKAINKPLDVDRIITQLKKTSNTQFEFNDINVQMDSNLFIPNISIINELRRQALGEIEMIAMNTFKRELKVEYPSTKNISPKVSNKELSVCFNVLNENLDYSKLDTFSKCYIPLKYFYNNKYFNIINILSKKADIYVYMPIIIRGNYKNLLANYLKSAIENFDIKGIVFSNIGNVEYLKFVNRQYGNKLKLIANYTLNVFNDNTIRELLDYGIDLIEVSPELNKSNILALCNSYGDKLEVFAYGKLPVMNTNYCFLGKSNKCYPNCDKKCFDTSKKYALVDRLGFEFRFIPDNIQTVTTVFNSRITSIETKDFNAKSCRINILDENIDEINEAISAISKGNRLEGSTYTNGNLNREI